MVMSKYSLLYLLFTKRNGLPDRPTGRAPSLGER
jgi:hypothetical protein